MFQYSLQVQKSIACYVHYRFLVLAVNIGTQPQIVMSEVRQYATKILANYIQIETFFNKTTFPIDRIEYIDYKYINIKIY